MNILDVRWFGGGSCIGIVRVQDEWEGIKYYIGSPPAGGIDETADTKWIADWGGTFPHHVGEVLFGITAYRNG